jgi:predicted  nucleic acid-binding Zn-ribbon protein
MTQLPSSSQVPANLAFKTPAVPAPAPAPAPQGTSIEQQVRLSNGFVVFANEAVARARAAAAKLPNNTAVPQLLRGATDAAASAAITAARVKSAQSTAEAATLTDQTGKSARMADEYAKGLDRLLQAPVAQKSVAAPVAAQREVNIPSSFVHTAYRAPAGVAPMRVQCGAALSDAAVLELLKYSTIVRSEKSSSGVSVGRRAAKQLVYFAPVALREAIVSATRGLVASATALTAQIQKLNSEIERETQAANSISAEVSAQRAANDKRAAEGAAELQACRGEIARLSAERASLESQRKQVEKKLAEIGTTGAVRSNPASATSAESIDDLITALMGNLAKQGVVGYRYGDAFVYTDEVNPALRKDGPKWAEWQKRNPPGSVVPAAALIDLFKQLVDVACRGIAALEAEVKSISARLNAAQVRLAELKKELAAARAVNAPSTEIVEDIRKCKAQLDDLKTALSTARGALADAQGSLDRALSAPPLIAPPIAALPAPPDSVPPAEVVEVLVTEEDVASGEVPAIVPQVTSVFAEGPTASGEVPAIVPQVTSVFAEGPTASEVDVCLTKVQACVDTAKGLGAQPATADSIKQVEGLLDQIEQCAMAVAEIAKSSDEAVRVKAEAAEETINAAMDEVSAILDKMKAAKPADVVAAPTRKLAEDTKTSSKHLYIGLGILALAAGGAYVYYKQRR